MAIAKSNPEAVNRIPLVISPENRDHTTNKDARLVNCFMETVRHDGKVTEIFINKRPGLVFSSQPSGGAATGLGAYNWKGDVYSIFGSTLYKNGVSKGTVDTTGGVYRFNSNLGAIPMLQLGNGVKGYNYDDTHGLVLIADPDFPASFVKGWAYLDQTTYVMTNSFTGVSGAIIQGSGLNDTTSWDPVNNLGPTIEPDLGVALGKQLVNVIALKQWTTEVFYDAGNATGSPLGRISGAKSNWGCLSADSVQDVDGVLIWLATTRIGTTSVVAMENLKTRTVSTRAVERLLDGINLGVIYSFQMQVAQHKFYVLTFKNANLTLAYDLAENMWSQLTDANGNYFPFVASVLDSNFNHILQHESNGKLYLAANSTYTNDDGQLIPVDIYTPNFDSGARRRKYISSLEVIGDQTPGSTLQVRFSDDDYQTWSQFRTVNMSLRRPFLVDCGTFYTRAHHLRHKANTTFRISALEAQVAMGSL